MKQLFNNIVDEAIQDSEFYAQDQHMIAMIRYLQKVSGPQFSL